ncbi:MAG: DUF4491 family protein [Coriobacteriales bacterium]|jgi:hypothetical protein|nr:DUF4491 family protein [Coriobacteriales bacterium]
MDFSGIILGAATFLIIGVMHPVVIKSYYYLGLKVWYAFLVIGIACAIASVFIPNLLVSIIVSIVGFSFLWGIHELFSERKRVRKGWHPANPKRETR